MKNCLSYPLWEENVTSPILVLKQFPELSGNTAPKGSVCFMGVRYYVI